MQSGSRGSVSLSARKYDVSDVISILDANEYPLLGILTNAGKDPVSQKGKAMKKKVTTDNEFDWYEDTYGTRRLTGSSTVDPDGGNLTLTAQTQYVQAGDILLVAAQKWVFELSSVTDENVVVVGAEKGGATGAAATAVGDVWIIGNANEEGAGLRNIKGTTPTKKTGYCQIFRTPFGATGSAMEIETEIKERDFDTQRRKKGIEHMIDIERAFLFSKLSKVSSGTHPKRTTNGILNVIQTYATANVDTEAEFETWLESLFAYGNTEKYLFASAAVISMVNGWAKNKLQLLPKDQTYGIRIYVYQSAHGTLNLIRHKLLTGTTYGYYAIGLDMEALTYRFLKNRDTKLWTNRQNPGDDGRVDEYLSEVGLQMEHEQKHAVMSMSSL